MNSLKTITHRWYVVIGAILIQLCLGAIYAWSVFTPSLVQASWTKAQTQTVFSVGLFCFAVVMVLAGRMMPKFGPRKVAISGGVLLGLGYILGGMFGETNFVILLLCIGIIGGSGIGLAYVVPIAVGMRWYPDKKGFITGLAVAGFGFGAMLWVKLAGTWGNLIATYGLSNTFTIYGLVFFLTITVGSLWMVFPPNDWKPNGWDMKEDLHVDGRIPEHNFTSVEMLKTPQFHLISMTFAFGASAGLMSIGLMKLFPMVALTAKGIDEASASAIAGTAMAIFFSLANGLGRIAWGAISDKLGRKRSIVIMMATQGVFVILFQWLAGTPALLYLGATLIGFNFGGNFALFPTITADTFGTEYVGQNYGWIFIAYGFGGILGPILGGLLGDMGNFPLTFTICGILCILAAGIMSIIHPPHKKILI